MLPARRREGSGDRMHSSPSRQRIWRYALPVIGVLLLCTAAVVLLQRASLENVPAWSEGERLLFANGGGGSGGATGMVDPVAAAVAKARQQELEEHAAKQARAEAEQVYRLAVAHLASSIRDWTGVELMATNAREVLQSHSLRFLASKPDPPGAVPRPPTPLPKILPLQLLPALCEKTGASEPPAACWNQQMYQEWQARSKHMKATLHARQATLDTLNAGKLPSERLVDPQAPARPTLLDVYVMVITGVTYHRARADIVMGTWGARFPAQNFVFITDMMDDADRLPVVPVNPAGNKPMSYEEGQRKWILGWKHAFAQTDLNGQHKWYGTFDDDGYASATNLLELVSKYDHNEAILIGSLCSWQPGLTRLCGGGGWLFSLGAAKIIRPILDTCQMYVSPNFGKHEWSDVFIGACFRDLLGARLQWINVQEFNQERLHDTIKTDAPWYLDRPHGFQRAITFHYVRPWPEQLGLFRVEQAFEAYGTQAFLRNQEQQMAFFAMLHWKAQQQEDEREEAEAANNGSGAAEGTEAAPVAAVAGGAKASAGGIEGSSSFASTPESVALAPAATPAAPAAKAAAAEAAAADVDEASNVQW